MGDNNLLMNTQFNFPGRQKLLLFVAKNEEFSFYYPLRRRGGEPAALPKIDWTRFPETGPRPGTHKSVDEFLAEFDFNLIQFSNDFNVYKYRFSGNFPEEIRVKIIATDLKTRLHAVSASSEAGKLMSRRFTFYDIAKLENLDLESKLTLLFGKRIGDEETVAPAGPNADNVVGSLANLPVGEEEPKKKELQHKTIPEIRDPPKKSDKRQTEVFFSAEKGEEVRLNREDYLLHSPAPKIPGAGGVRRYHGTIKVFFDEDKYGFFQSDDYGQDVYVALDDLKKAGVTKKTVHKNRDQVYSFLIHEYQRKNKQAKKAVEIRMLED